MFADNTTVRMETGSGRFMAAMSYLGILVLVPLALKPKDSYVTFHARQGAVLWIWEMLAIYALSVPGLGKMLFQFSSIACFLLSAVGLIAVLLGRAWRLPLVGTLSDRL
ncbi:MAG: hypothetical protein HQL82_14640 [Magnetococcales bacterium]|nr:hypothetical protein [Magnetococcales bacterium]